MAQHILSICLSTWLMATTLQAQSDLSVAVQQETAGYDATLAVDVTLTADQAVSAGQWDLLYDAEKLDYVSLEGSPELPGGLQGLLQLVEPGIIRFVLFSLTNEATFPGADGWTWSLEFETNYDHGAVPFSLDGGLVVGEGGSTLELTTTNDQAVVVGPSFHLATSEVSFGDVPMLSQAVMTLEVLNQGNAPLTLESVGLESPFSLVDVLPLVVEAEGSTTLSVAVSTASKTNASSTFTVVSNDPAPLRSAQSFDASVNVFAVNELHLGGENVVLGEPFEVTLAANNMEPFSAFQLDVVLPEGVLLVADSEVWSGREADHILALSQVGPNTVRLLGFSPSNAEFNGADGELCTFQLVSNETANSVALGVENGLMSNVALGDVMSAAYGVTLSQAYPVVNLPASTELGIVPIGVTQNVSLTVSNGGAAALELEDLQSQQADVEVLTAFPITLAPGASTDVELAFTPTSAGEISAELALTHNAEGGFTATFLQADVIVPNYLYFQDDFAPVGGTWSSEVRLFNTDAIKGMQFDVQIPEGIAIGAQDFVLSPGWSSFQLSTSSLGDNAFRLIVFSLSGAAIPPGDEALVLCQGSVGQGMIQAAYDLPLTNVVLSNASNENVSTVALQLGQMTVNCPEDLDGDGLCDGCVGDLDACGICNGPGEIYECGCANIPAGDCDCNGNQVDVVGVCGGNCTEDADADGICDDVDDCVGQFDACGVCNGPGAVFDCGCTGIPAGDCDCDGHELDACGVCGGPGAAFECGCTNIPSGDCDCNGNQLDALGVCGGSCVQDLDQDGICDDVDECVGTLDSCGICNGPGDIYECGCANIPAGDCDCGGNQLDVLGVCGGSCVQDLDQDGICDDVDTCVGTLDAVGDCNGACLFDIDSDGICDDVDECVGTLDACGICNGPGDIYECGCANIPAGDCDCNGNQLDALGVCGGACTADADGDGICDDVDTCVGALDACGICNGPGDIYECGCANIPAGDCDCGGNQLDALGVCGGSCVQDLDQDGICDDVDTCVGALDACGICNGPGDIYECGCANIPAGDCDCNGNQLDALGVCGGACTADADGDGICDDVDTCVGALDACGICNGPGDIYECGCANIPAGDCDCGGNQLDALGVCGGSCAQDLDQDGICDDVDTCVGALDACGICNGPGDIYECGCANIPAGDCDCGGNQLDALGVCGGSCVQDLDQDGICDDVDTCVGALDACGICNGPGDIYECGCANIPAGDCDCNGNQLDALGVCGGACTADADGDGICDDVDTCVGALDACGICNGPGDIYECGCANIPAGDCDCSGNQLDALGVCGGSCVQDLDQDGICDDVDECVGALDACGICNGPGDIYECGCANIPAGDCDCSGNQLDALGVCGGSCVQDLDQDGICDDVDECVGALDACGICNGPGEIYECGCVNIPAGDCDCNGNQVDVVGVCGGNCTEDADADGICDDVDDCVGQFDACGVCNGPGAVFDCGCTGIPAGDCDCDGHELDACGVCGGPGAAFECGCTNIPSGDCDCNGNQLDALGVCGGSCVQDLDQDGICDDVDECVGTLDSCGICNGPGDIYECGCANIPAGDCDCNGNQLDALGVCGGACTADADGDGICDDVDECVGTLDACGICNGPGEIYECGCANIPAGDCDCNGNQLDALGVCGGSCVQDLDQDGICDDVDTCVGTLDAVGDCNGACLFDIDSDGICDDVDECVGTLDACGICNGPGDIYECGCANIPAGDCDCNGNQLDALGVCGGACTADADGDGICDDVDTCVGALDACGICNGPGEIYECGCANIPAGDCDCNGNQLDALGVCGGSCVQDLDQDGICDDVDTCVGALDACGICNGPGDIYECGCANIPAGDCDCGGNQLDALGVCGGACSADADGDGICDDVDECVGTLDDCGICNGPGEIYECGCNDIPAGDCNCNGGQLDAVGVCGGVCVADVDGDGICDNVDECVGSVDVLGQCNGACLFDIDADGICDDVDECVGTLDACGICNGPGAIYECGCTGLAVGECDCFGNTLDATGECGGNCLSDVDNDGICDYLDDCIGLLDACGICNGPGAVYDCGCSGIPVGDCDCDGTQLDALGVCGGPCESDADGDGVCDDIDVCVGIVDECGVCNGQGAVYECGCQDIACGECDCAGNQLDALGVCGGNCISDVDNDGICDYLDSCIGIPDECGVCNGPGAVYDCGCFAIPEGDCDCSGNQFDALGVCGGGCTDDDGNGLCDQHEGCVYVLAFNYDPDALFDNGTCVFGIDQSCPADLNGDDSVGSADLLLFLAEYGAECP